MAQGADQHDAPKKEAAMKLPPIQEIQDIRNAWSEAGFQGNVIALAHGLGFTVAHFRTVRVQRANGSVSYQTPVQADGAGFPDLVMVGHGRVVFVELKANKGRIRPEQEAWIAMLRDAGASVFLWKPKQWDEIAELLEKWAAE
jgi:hypothetical protein